jgi:macrolide-specific efflux system membrane fusion protein
MIVPVVAAAWFEPRLFGASPETSLSTAVIERGSVERTVTAVGSLKPKEYVDVGTQVSGQLQAVHVEIGDRVAKGDLIAEIDPARYQSTVRTDRAHLEQLNAQLLQQHAELKLARQQLARNREMAAARAVSEEAVDQAAATAKVAEARMAATRAQIRAAEATLEGDLANLGYTRIHAPMDGTVVSQTSFRGQTVNASQAAPVIVQIANLDVMTVWAQVAEADVTRIAPGMPAWFTTLGMPERRWQGTVRQVQPTPEITNDVVLYNVLIDVDNREKMLLPSMTAQTFFVLAEARDVPVAPLSALDNDRAAGPDIFRATVLTPRGPESRIVETGVRNRTSAEIVSGIEVGEVLVLSRSESGSSDDRRRRVPAMSARL